MTALFGERHRRLADVMDRRGAWPERSPWVREAVEALPRHLFAPDRLWCWEGDGYAPVDRSADASRWADELYAAPDRAAVTGVARGAVAAGLPCQGVVADLLGSLRLEPGQRVLELGAGTGWSAALLAHRAGAGRVTSVEPDPVLAAAARGRLEAAGAGVAVEVGDAAAGWARGAPYDRVVATCPVDRIPWAWVAQTRPGGLIVTRWGRLGHVALTVADDGSAGGWVQGLAHCAPTRGTDRFLDAFDRVRAARPHADPRCWDRDPAPLRDDWDLRFALRVALPDVQVCVVPDGEGLDARLHDGASSWAALRRTGDGATTACQGGPRRLADELEHAWDGWLDAGSPDVHEYGLTVESPHCQYAWALDQETGPRWPLVP